MKPKTEYRIEEREEFSVVLSRAIKWYVVEMKIRSFFLRREIWEPVGEWRGSRTGVEVPFRFGTKAQAQAYINFYSK